MQRTPPSMMAQFFSTISFAINLVYWNVASSISLEKSVLDFQGMLTVGRSASYMPLNTQIHGQSTLNNKI
jgi:hypothetical protein